MELCPELEVKIKAQGHLKYIVAPNFFHHLFVGDYADRFPNADLFYSQSLDSKLKDQMALFQSAKPLAEVKMPWQSEVLTRLLPGMPKLAEYQFFHKKDRVIISHDLYFNVSSHRDLTFRAKVTAGLLGLKSGQPVRSRLLKLLTKDKSALKAYLQSIKDLKPKAMVCAHGEITTTRLDEHLDRLISLV